MGGGSNTFAGLFEKYASKNGHKIVSSIDKAERAIIVAHLGDEESIRKAKANGCYIVHRLDEHFESDETGYRKEKHDLIRRLNKLADVTIYQSLFVQNNVQPFLAAENFKVIYNGTDPKVFFPGKKIGQFVGHVSWGIDQKKRLDLLHQFILKNPKLNFLLVGRHGESEFDFKLPNVKMVGAIKNKKIADYYREMNFLFFPSENDPCPNTVIEAILCGVPVVYNPIGGTIELVQDCGVSLDQVDKFLESPEIYRQKCQNRSDLHFQTIFEKYIHA